MLIIHANSHWFGRDVQIWYFCKKNQGCEYLNEVTYLDDPISISFTNKFKSAPTLYNEYQNKKEIDFLFTFCVPWNVHMRRCDVIFLCIPTKLSHVWWERAQQCWDLECGTFGMSGQWIGWTNFLLSVDDTRIFIQPWEYICYSQFKNMFSKCSSYALKLLQINDWWKSVWMKFISV